MKKRVTKAKVKKTAPRSRKRTVKTAEISFVPFSFRRIILVTTCMILFLFVALLFTNNGNVTQSVAGISVARGLFAQATISLPKVEEAVAYNIYYKKTTDEEYTNSVRSIPTSVSSYTISYLTKGASYNYKIAAVNEEGREFLWSEVQTLTDLQPM